MPIDDNREITVERMKAMLGPPPLIVGEDEESYWKWWSVFVEEHQPKRLSDWLEVNDLAHKQWEQDRLRSCNSAIIEGVLYKALKNLLRPFCNPLSSNELHLPENLARGCYFGDDEDRKEARADVEAWGITDAHIIAEAMGMRRDALLLLDRMDSHRSNARRLLLKDLDRRKEARRNPSPDQPVDGVADVISTSIPLASDG